WMSSARTLPTSTATHNPALPAHVLRMACTPLLSRRAPDAALISCRPVFQTGQDGPVWKTGLQDISDLGAHPWAPRSRLWLTSTAPQHANQKVNHRRELASAVPGAYPTLAAMSTALWAAVTPARRSGGPANFPSSTCPAR